MGKLAAGVILREAKNPIISKESIIEILRLPLNDITAQPLKRGGTRRFSSFSKKDELKHLSLFNAR